MDQLLTIILLFFGVMMLARVVTILTTPVPRDKDGRPINPNMSEPCPPHKWAEPPQKGLGIVYQCTKCGQKYPDPTRY